jgi:hypothetical protein
VVALQVARVGLQDLAPIIGLAQFQRLQQGAVRAVEDEDAAGECFSEGRPRAVGVWA